jgi:3-keto-5-aminohexanoate cleavage enzyme
MVQMSIKSENQSIRPKKLIIDLDMAGSLSEIVSEVSAAYMAGASIVHHHVRDEQGKNLNIVADLDIYRQSMEMIRKNCPDILFDLSLHSAHDTVEERLKPIAELGIQTEIGILYAGTFNFGSVSNDELYLNTRRYMREATRFFQERGMKAMLAVHGRAMIEEAKRVLIDTGIYNKPYLFLKYFGQPYQASGTWEEINYIFKALPPNSELFIGPEGRNWLDISIKAIMFGGHLKIGISPRDYQNRYLNPYSNERLRPADMISKVSLIAKDLGREVASPKETRKMLGIT